MPRIVKTLDTKDPSEGDVITFDFSLSMPTGSSIVGTPAVICEVAFGTDPSPSSVLSGVPSVSGNQVLQAIVGGVSGAQYHLRCVVILNVGGPLTLACVLPVQRI